MIIVVLLNPGHPMILQANVSMCQYITEEPIGFSAFFLFILFYYYYYYFQKSLSEKAGRTNTVSNLYRMEFRISEGMKKIHPKDTLAPKETH